MYRCGPRSPWIGTDECRFRPIGHVVVDAMTSHFVILSSDGGIVSDGLVLGFFGSADIVGDSFTGVGAADRGQHRHVVEKLCDGGGATAATKDVLAPLASAMTALRQ